ncbi:MAG: YraN family protein [Opitutus sp.]|nr:YraN family protein [Opitutus sp.]MCS6246467.1 YraN family protein [Opitutus sp.]MCS6273358.1 YraN family protein [Opitutus sp.]MCS6278762.1 YraN family protein [Opitutus sp.]MCS6299660.1 YraN family protein [Opitutus sp.]
MWQRLKSWLGPKLFSMNEKTGERGERLAAVFLQNQGYAVVARNWRDPNDRRDELDLVCRDGEVLVFVEVKTRAAGALVAGYYAVDKRKKTVVRRAATAYLRTLQPRPRTFRFDVIEVAVSSSGSTEVRHFENIELFPKHFRP